MSILVQLKEIDKLPTLPEIIIKVQELINSDASNATSLAQLIKQDPALSSTILKTANSAYYNFAKRRISSISEAIARIGFNEVLKINPNHAQAKECREISLKKQKKSLK